MERKKDKVSKVSVRLSGQALAALRKTAGEKNNPPHKLVEKLLSESVETEEPGPRPDGRWSEK